MKEAVWLFDPVSNQPEQIPVEPNMKKAVKSAHAAYKEHLVEEKELERKKKKNRKREEGKSKATEKEGVSCKE